VAFGMEKKIDEVGECHGPSLSMAGTPLATINPPRFQNEDLAPLG